MNYPGQQTTQMDYYGSQMPGGMPQQSPYITGNPFGGGNPPQPAPQQNSKGSENDSDAPYVYLNAGGDISQDASLKKSKFILILMIVLMILGIAGAAAFAIIRNLDLGYDKPINNLMKAFTNVDYDLYFHSCYPPEWEKLLEEKDEKYIINRDANNERLTQELATKKQTLEDRFFGPNSKWSCEILSKSDADGSDLSKIQEVYDLYGVEVKKGKKVNVKITLKGDNDSASARITLYVVKFKEGDWYLAPVYADGKVWDIASGSIFDLDNRLFL